MKTLFPVLFLALVMVPLYPILFEKLKKAVVTLAVTMLAFAIFYMVHIAYILFNLLN